MMPAPLGRPANNHLVRLLIRPDLLRDPELRLLASRLLAFQQPEQIARELGCSRRKVTLRIDRLQRLRQVEEAP